MKKRLLSTMLVLCVVLALCPRTTWAADTDFIIEDGELVEYTGPGGAVTIPDGVTAIGEGAFFECTSLTSVTIPNSVTTIEDNAFDACISLTNVNIPDGVTSIGQAAFNSCSSLTNVIIPNSVTSIKYQAFEFCISLTSVTIPNSVTSIGNYAFYGCEDLASVIISDSVISIGEGTFSECYSLTSVTIPNSVISIELGAFGDCDSLTDVYYSGSEGQWKQISIEAFNDELLNATIHYNSTRPDVPAQPEQPSTPAAPSAPVPTSVVLSPQKLAVDDKTVDCEKYNIDGSNYFKLRDLAQLLNGTGSQFGVGFDAATSTVAITTGQAYESTGTELAAGVDNSATTQPSSQSILINGTAHGELTVYNIGGSNFFQLRELGNLLNFEVGYDVDTNTATVTSVQ